MKIGHKSLKKIWRYIMLHISNFPMPGHWRWHFVRMGGVNFNISANCKDKFIFIGNNIVWDTAYPEEIEIQNHVHITTGCVLLTHYMSIDHRGWIKWKKGHIKIEEYAFIGARTIITKPVTIGRNAIVAAGSVVSHDIPPYEIWGGVPAKFIKKIEIKE